MEQASEAVSRGDIRYGVGLFESVAAVLHVGSALMQLPRHVFVFSSGDGVEIARNRGIGIRSDDAIHRDSD
jgi:hypothetical protein